MTTQDKPNDVLAVRMPADLRATIERQAVRDHRTVSGQVRYLIAVAIETQAARQREHAA
jgi:CopG-like RHH_1 or ribbon-helix-helix domain, RHH_5